VLVGATASGKSHWASQWFDPDQVVSSDRLRAAVGLGERDQRASRDAFEVLDLIVSKRLQRRLTTVIDSTGLDGARRETWRSLAERRGLPTYAIVFDPPATVVRERNRARASCARPPRSRTGWQAKASRPCTGQRQSHSYPRHS
jgi:predicted kinase